MNKKDYKIIAIIFLCAFIGTTRVANAAKLFFVSDPDRVSIGDIVTVDAYVDPESQSINAMSADITFPSSILSLQKIDTGKSIISNWIESPHLSTNSNNHISLSGIIPGGYTGTLSPFYKGIRGGKIVELVFKAIADGSGVVSIGNAVVLINDGKGTPASTDTNNLVINVGIDNQIASTTSKTATTSSIDTGVVESTDVSDIRYGDFIVSVEVGDANTDGRPLLVFEDIEKNRSLFKYQIAFKWNDTDPVTGNLSWTDATSPYVLTEAQLSDYIFIKSIGLDGSERVYKLSPHKHSSTRQLLLLCIAVVVVGALYIYFRRRIKR